MSNNIYKVGRQGGRDIIDFPAKDNEGNKNRGRSFKRTVWKDGTVTYKEVKA